MDIQRWNASRSVPDGNSTFITQGLAIKLPIYPGKLGEVDDSIHLDVPLVESTRHNEHHIVDHVTVGAVVQKLAQACICLHTGTCCLRSIACSTK